MNELPFAIGNPLTKLRQPIVSSSLPSSTFAEPSNSLPTSVRARHLLKSNLGAAPQTAPPTQAFVRKAAADVNQPWSRFRFAAEHGGAGWRLQRLRRLFGADDNYSPNPNAAAYTTANSATTTTTAKFAKFLCTSDNVNSSPGASMVNAPDFTRFVSRGFTVGLDSLLIASHSEVELAPKEYRTNVDEYDPHAPLVVLAVDPAGVLSWSVHAGQDVEHSVFLQ